MTTAVEAAETVAATNDNPGKDRSYLTAEDIAGFPDLEKTEVEIKAWGNRVICLRALTMAEALEAKRRAFDADVQLRDEVDLWLITRSAIAPDGSPVFKDERGIALLKKKNLSAVNEVIEAINKLNKLGDYAPKKEKPESKSPTPSGFSHTDSQ
jgi:hypothetical protein